MVISSSDAGTAAGSGPRRTACPASPGPATAVPRAVPAPVDATWAAGYEMGRLDAQLAARPVRVKVGLTIRAVNRDAATALARRHDYDLHVRAAVEEEFVWVEFWPRR